jgi:hypothetical protein
LKTAKVRICSICHEELSSAGEIILDAYVAICFASAEDASVVVDGRRTGTGNTVVKWLEKRGYITSTEFNDSDLLVTANGLEVVEGFYRVTYEFCVARSRHK